MHLDTLVTSQYTRVFYVLFTFIHLQVIGEQPTNTKGLKADIDDIVVSFHWMLMRPLQLYQLYIMLKENATINVASVTIQIGVQGCLFGIISFLSSSICKAIVIFPIGKSIAAGGRDGCSVT